MRQFWRQWRRARRTRIARKVAARTDGVVQAGPFAGLRYTSPEAVGSTIAPKLLGTYERELHGVVEAAIERAPERVLNIGAGEGYYAVGLALRLPRARVTAWESDTTGRELGAGLARANGVADRVKFLATCTPTELAAVLRQPALVVCDVEGAEASLLDPAAVPGLRGCEVLAEMHGRGHRDTTAVVRARFERTHHAQMIPVRARRSSDAEAPWLSRSERRIAVDERRRDGLRWLHLLPRGTQ